MGRIRDIRSGTGGADWRGMTWRVVLTLDSRANVTRVEATAIHKRHPVAEPTYGHASQDVGPFDSVSDAIDTVTVDSALATVIRKEADWEQRPLWD